MTETCRVMALPVLPAAAIDGRRRAIFPAAIRVFSLSDLAIHLLALLFVAAFIAGFVDSIAGGGGLITIPVMLIAGIPPLDAIATNKLQAQFGVASETVAYAQKRHIDLRSEEHTSE